MSKFNSKIQSKFDHGREKLNELEAKLKQHSTIMQLTGMALERFMDALILGPSLDPFGGSVDMTFTLDKHGIEALWSNLRKCGWVPDNRPEKQFSTFSCFWRHEEDQLLKMFISFTSKSCRRVKVGTKMVEQPVYELVCDELEPMNG